MPSNANLWFVRQAPLDWNETEGCLELLDQRRLPLEEIWHRYDRADDVIEAIRSMVVRGAPAIGCAAAMGLAAEARWLARGELQFHAAFEAACERMAIARPTAVNLAWAVERQRTIAREMSTHTVEAITWALCREATRIWKDDIAACRAIGQHGASLIVDGASILTHCNAGALATGGYGTALGVIRAAAASGKRIHVFVDETRPFLQGSRLTAWELVQERIPATLICDNMAGALMKAGRIGCCIVGADRIAMNGDVANKIGTYALAVSAQYHRIPFYVAAPLSTFDRQIATGEEIPIEQRSPDEVTSLAGVRVAPHEVSVMNPAFDVTPHELVSAIITPQGVITPPYDSQLPALMREQSRS